MDAEMRVMQPQAQEHQEPPEAERCRKDPSIEFVEGAWLRQHLDFRLLGLRSVREPICGRLLWQPPEETTQHTDADGGEASLRACGVSFSGSLLSKQTFAELLPFARLWAGPRGWR